MSALEIRKLIIKNREDGVPLSDLMVHWHTNIFKFF